MSRTTCSTRLLQGGKRIAEQQVSLVEDENEFGFFQITDFRQVLEQLRQQPEQKSGIEPGFSISSFAARMLMRPRPLESTVQQVGQVQCWFAEKRLPPFTLQRQQRAEWRRWRVS